MDWLLDNYIGLLIAITLFMIYAKLDEVQIALKENTRAVVNVEQEIGFLSAEQQAFRDLRRPASQTPPGGFEVWA
jgi:hypothetical protein